MSELKKRLSTSFILVLIFIFSMNNIYILFLSLVFCYQQLFFEFMKLLIATVDEEDEGHEEYWKEECGFKISQFRCQHLLERVDVLAIYKDNLIEFDLQRTYLKTNNRKT